jgi:hypothetical protein
METTGKWAWLSVLRQTRPADGDIKMPDTVTSLEELVEALSTYGRPHVMLHDDGFWSCSAKLHTNMKKAPFEVKSAFSRHKQMRGAVEECLQKAVQAVAKFEFTLNSK